MVMRKNTVITHKISKLVVLVFLILLWNIPGVNAADNTKEVIGHISVKAGPFQKGIKLRWAASSAAAWRLGNQYGYWIDRYAIVRNGELLPQPEYERLTATPLKPRPALSWRTIAQRNDMAAIIAQALYGNTFTITAGSQQGFAKIHALAQEQEQRFTMSLYAADMNFEAACFAGWGYTDLKADSNVRYVYRILPALPEGKKDSITLGFVYTSIADYKPLPKPIALQAQFGDKMVSLSWDYETLKSVYGSYQVEKSEDGKHYTVLNETPLSVMTQSSNSRINQRMLYVDSLSKNNQRVYYRVSGISIFEEVGQPSDSVYGYGLSKLYSAPAITRAVVNDSGSMEIAWTFEEQDPLLIAHFELNQSLQVDEHYEIVQQIDKSNRRTVYSKLYSNNYFTVSAVSIHGDKTSSFPVLVQPADMSPPAKPTGLRGSIDTTGNVLLSWDANMESDLQGYRVYRAFNLNEDLVLLCDSLILTNTVADEVEVMNLNATVYYAVSAVDYVFNHSVLSDVLSIEKPDLVPPTAPFIVNGIVHPEGVEITWENSMSRNVHSHQLYRRRQGQQADSALVAEFQDVQQRYEDNSVEDGIGYTYWMQAVKKNGLKSPLSNTIDVIAKRVKELSFKSFDAIVDNQNNIIKLMWVCDVPNIERYELYRATDNGAPTLWKRLNSQTTEVIEEGVQAQKQYSYTLRGITKDGKALKTKELKIKY
ncbi:hypothetical protein FACS1894201_03470 [Bacteroidia bacterium]|nr:hypothetical protein FACS1894201_03470 [Bacteroidia bacterium]